MDGKSAEYVGETARYADTRRVKHMKSLRLEDEENPLWKHKGINAEFKMLVVGVHRT